MKAPTNTADRDRKTYDLARRCLLGLQSAGVTEEVLQHYLNPPSNRETPNTTADVFKRLLESAQNRGMMPSVIGGSIGGVRAIEQTLQQRSKLGFWDAMIVEAAHQLGCTTLWAEDLTDNQLLQGVRVRNPFQ